MDQELRAFVPCARGLEQLIVGELRNLDAMTAKAGVGGVYMEMDLDLCYRALLWLRVGSRVLWPIAKFPAATAEALYLGANRLPWENHVFVDKTLAVRTTIVGVQPGFENSHFTSLKLKDAIVDRLRDVLGDRPSIDPEFADLRIHLHLEHGVATVSIDLAGHGLHRRGYRLEASEAPLREDLAAAMLLRSGWPEIAARGGSFVDPFCGSGTLLVEAALIAGDVAPRIGRDHFGFMGWRKHDTEIWSRALADAKRRREAGRDRIPTICGSDIDPYALKRAAANIERAGLTGCITLTQADASDMTPPAGEPGLMATNPPYGERLGSQSDLRAVYKRLGKRLLEHFRGWEATVLTSDRELAQAIGLRTRRRTKLNNGGIECQLLRFRLHAQAR